MVILLWLEGTFCRLSCGKAASAINYTGAGQSVLNKYVLPKGPPQFSVVKRTTLARELSSN
jgi:hypothetical protein